MKKVFIRKANAIEHVWTIPTILLVTAGLFLIFLTGCTTTKVYETPNLSCTWQHVEELIICRGEKS